jgi:3-oxoacyl-[acyl-carrier protein] reductase
MSKGRLDGKVAVVTGASKGIGAGIARAVGAEGASVVVNYAGDKAGAQKVVDAITASGGKAIAVQGNVAKLEDVKRLFQETGKAFGRLDVLVNNAGIYNFVSAEQNDEAEYRRQFDTNVLGPLQTTREALPLFGERGGSIINISSVVSRTGFPGASIYSGTKGALDAISFVFANELGPRKIRVNIVAPGLTESEGTHAVGAIANMAEGVVARTALGRIGQPQDIAGIVTFLASDESGWLTGERIVAAGGYS